MGIRRCAVAGAFYPAEASQLLQVLDLFFQKERSHNISAFGIVSPHAGYIYSGVTAACAFNAIPEDFDGTFVVIGPSHRGSETCISVDNWETPIGTLIPDQDFLDALKIPSDSFSHRNEHSLEVQMPFIQYRYPNARIAPIMMGNQNERSSLSLSGKILSAVKDTERNVKIIASSDFSHYVPKEKAVRDDGYAIMALQSLNVPLFYHRIREKNLSVCGYGPISTMVHVAKELGATEGKLLQYATSGEVTNEFSEVVGYAAIAVV